MKDTDRAGFKPITSDHPHFYLKQAAQSLNWVHDAQQDSCPLGTQKQHSKLHSRSSKAAPQATFTGSDAPNLTRIQHQPATRHCLSKLKIRSPRLLISKTNLSVSALPLFKTTSESNEINEKRRFHQSPRRHLTYALT